MRGTPRPSPQGGRPPRARCTGGRPWLPNRRRVGRAGAFQPEPRARAHALAVRDTHSHCPDGRPRGDGAWTGGERGGSVCLAAQPPASWAVAAAGGEPYRLTSDQRWGVPSLLPRQQQTAELSFFNGNPLKHTLEVVAVCLTHYFSLTDKLFSQLNRINTTKVELPISSQFSYITNHQVKSPPSEAAARQCNTTIRLF